jgi:hypothetical protein
MGFPRKIADLTSDRFKTIERPQEPTTSTRLIGDTAPELTPEARSGYAALARLSARNEAEGMASWEAQRSARAQSEAARDAAILARVAAR